MLDNIISLENALQLSNTVFIDMRSPAEYNDGRIPGAVNIPLLDNEERSQVGTVYKTVGPDEAKNLGLSLVSGKLPDIVSQIKEYHKAGRKVIVYCWRGGMRSKAVVSVLNLMGVPALQLAGGYKGYRRLILDRLAGIQTLPQVVMLCGSTGVGKTEILNMLAGHGVPVIDLEKLANHRGSAFGQVSLGKPQTAQNFDAALLSELERLEAAPYLLVECESKRIGNVYLPNVLYHAMQNGKKILAYASLETRITRLINEYTGNCNYNSNEIVASLGSLKSRISAVKLQKLHEDFTAGHIREFVRDLLVNYYDPLYGYEKANQAQFDFTVNADDLETAAINIKNYLDEVRG